MSDELMAKLEAAYKDGWLDGALTGDKGELDDEWMRARDDDWAMWKMEETEDYQ